MTAPSQSAVAYRLNEMGIARGSNFELSAGDCDVLERALNNFAGYCDQVERELTMLVDPKMLSDQPDLAGHYRRSAERARRLRDIFQFSPSIVANEVGEA